MFYIEENNKIVLFDEDRERLINTLSFMPQYNSLEIKETDRPIVDFQFADTDEYQQEQAQKERERINMLSLTAADVERAIYKAKGLDFEDILKQLSSYEAEQLGELDLKALKIELKANNFYRGNPYIEQVGALLGFTPEMLDEFFETGDYTKLIAAPSADEEGEKPLDNAQMLPAEAVIEEEVNADTTNTESNVQVQTPVKDSISEK